MKPANGLVWVTGASSGIGRATALHLARRGYDVAASARNEAALTALRERHERIYPYPLDVADPVAREHVYEKLRADLGPVDVLVNNAGYGIRGAVEEMPAHELRDIFDVNVFAPLALARLVLPEMRARREGRIIMVSSVSGRVSAPLNGAYSASKFALEAFSDSMRVEVAQWNIRVVLVEPGPIRTKFGDTAKDRSLRVLRDEKSAYANQHRRLLEKPLWRPEEFWGAASVAETIRRAIEAERPRARYPVHPYAWLLPLAEVLLPTAIRDRLMGERFGFTGDRMC
ncbi:MAG: 3-oxoacyl-[acyl-carrier-protein] reductase FabG [Calditrichaeota bacterium]|nr:3-oxoacyl-[acyl-carrier-protein] reductase FabG [Calditrichota bacterium]